MVAFVAYDRARQLRDQVLKTWNPPLTGAGSQADIAQTATMVTLAYVFGVDFIGPVSHNQFKAIESGLTVFRECFK